MPHPGQRPLVLRQTLAMGVDEDVGVDRDQDRPSMRSYRESRSLMSTPGSSAPLTVFRISLWAGGAPAGGVPVRVWRSASSMTPVRVRCVWRARLCFSQQSVVDIQSRSHADKHMLDVAVC